VANLNEPEWDASTDEWQRSRLATQIGSEHLGLSLYELAPGQKMVFHYHLENEEILIALRGRPTLRTFDGERELEEGEVVHFPRGQEGAHGFENRTGESLRVLVVSEMNGPRVSIYPDTMELGILDSPHPQDRSFGALFKLDDARPYGTTAPVVPPDEG
jgi:uncharacterized cupin superfamily protein